MLKTSYIDCVKEMLRNYIVPKRLKTTHFLGQKVLIWINEKKIERIDEVDPQERHFIRDFVTNLEKLGWKVLIQL